ncbi:MAG: adenylate/guanylate cyclase domain-containing protein [Rhodocyclaceae bacterium]|nr:adenylate/guanylate cyclase domain-containing protein [Rhodocyclaceae bacterium]
MNTTLTDGFLARLRQAGIRPDDDERERLNKTLLVFATGLISITSALWLIIYGAFGTSLSSTLPFVYQLLLTGNLVIYIRTGNFPRFRAIQLSLFLLAPFVLQWAIGDFINSSGVILWGLLGPFGAMVCLGTRESLGWFLAWVGLTLLSGLGDLVPLISQGPDIPMRISIGFFALNFIAVASIIFILLRYSILEQEKVSTRLADAHMQLIREQRRSESLLLNILPAPVAARLKDSEDDIIADGFDYASVMFADIVSYTQVAAHLQPHEVFSLLNRVFSAFDDLAERHGLEKIKTIGDAYMVAGGLNLETARHVHAMAALAVEMRALLRNNADVNPIGLELHIGIATGPVIAGVLGKHKFVYDLWGDTVNLASRITEEAGASQILCDPETRRILGDAEFIFAAPTESVLRGRGSTPLYELLDGKSTVPQHN